MAVSWSSYSVLPFAVGGAGRVRVVLGSDQALAVAALAGPAGGPPPSDPDAVGFSRIDLALSEDSPEWRGNFFGWAENITVYLFAQTAAGWEPPVSFAAQLPWRYSEADFPWIRPWIVARLQEVADRMAPLGNGERVKVSAVFPEDTKSFPIVSVQVDSVAPAGDSIGRVISASSSKLTRGTLYNISISLVAWSETPEDREDLAAWLGMAMEILIEILPAIGCMEPSASIEESEDFQTLDVPTFLATAHLNTSRWSRLAAARPSEFGLLTV